MSTEENASNSAAFQCPVDISPFPPSQDVLCKFQRGKLKRLFASAQWRRIRMALLQPKVGTAGGEKSFKKHQESTWHDDMT